MIALLENPAIRSAAAPLSRAAYRLLAEQGLIAKNTELIEGLLVEKMSKSPRHAATVKLIQKIIAGFLPDAYTLQVEQPLALGNSEPEPDLAIVKGRPEEMMSEHPQTAEVVIEVASSSSALDQEKASIYAAANIPRYFIINLKENCVQDFSRPAGGRYNAEVMLRSGLLEIFPGIIISLDQILRP